jgi:O-antigen ligase
MSLPMNAVLLSMRPIVAIVLVLVVGVCLIRWAKKGGRSVAMLGSALVLLLGAGLAPAPPQQRMEEAREEKGKKGAESGDPPNP